MSIKLRTLELENLNLNDMDHYCLIKNNENDFTTKKYISNNLMKFVKEGNDEYHFETGKTYILKDKRKLVGLIGTKKMRPNGVVELWCNIDKTFRGMGYGKKSLEEITPYMIENVDGLNDIELMINRSNYPSKHMAEEVGYIKTDDSGDINKYNYFGNSK